MPKRRASSSAFAGLTVALGLAGLANGCQLLSGVSDMRFGSASVADSGSGGMGGSPSGAGGVGGEPTPTPCEQASDCPPSKSPCEAPICVAKLCGTVAVSAGSKAALAAQVDGDCRELVCNGEGVAVEKVDDSDIPDDGSDCTDDACIDGTPVAAPRPYGSSCGAEQLGQCNGSGECVECLSDADCGAPTECAAPHCVEGACQSGAKPAGAVLTIQTPGDCTRRVCDGAGHAIDEADDADVPDDGNDCTDDLCQSGVPSTAPTQSGATCGNAPAMTCNGMGACTGCSSAADCSGVDDACRTRSCVGGICSIANKPAGTKLPADAQTPGNCSSKVCTELGLVAEAADDDPPPDDGNPCTYAACVDGMPVHPPTTQALPCDVDGGKVCDGSGSCVACNAAADCSGADGPCQSNSCVEHACGVLNAANNAPAAASSQVAGDCKIVRCDGNGGTLDADLDADLPVDGLPCTQDLCAGGVPSNPPEPAGAACQSLSGGKKCDGKGVCVQCLLDADCPKGACIAGMCNDCQLKSCLDLGLTCGQATDGCGGDLLCDDQAKNGLETGTDCGGDEASCPTRCSNGVACLVDADCQSGQCEQGVCCNVACDGACRSCRAADTGGLDGQCGFVASGDDPWGQCAAGKTCDGAGACKGASGTPCSKATDCASGSCPANDGVCCSSACAGVCESCRGAKTGEPDGVCAPIMADTDPDNECVDQGAASCGKSGVCNGLPASNCKLYVDGTVCKAGSCDAAKLEQTAPSTCDGAGLCEAGAVSSCNGFQCGAAACKTSCVSGADCAATHFCGGGGVCNPKKALGATCAVGAQCTSGFCRDGVCCDGACDGTCAACSAAKTGGVNGTCAPVAFATDPDNECNLFTPVCSGGGSCAACGITLVAPGGLCPNECTGGCDDATRTCTIGCDVNDNQCAAAALVCPAGWNCEVLCGRKGACKAASVACPSDYTCKVDCSADAESCAELSLSCKNGNCNLACHGAPMKNSCTGAKVSCGSNVCTSTCDLSYVDPTKFPVHTPNGSCSCSSCGIPCL